MVESVNGCVVSGAEVVVLSVATALAFVTVTVVDCSIDAVVVSVTSVILLVVLCFCYFTSVIVTINPHYILCTTKGSLVPNCSYLTSV